MPRKIPSAVKGPGMTNKVKAIARIIVPLTVLFGSYLVLHGQNLPGGGVAGGVIITAAFILLTVVYGKQFALHKLGILERNLLEWLGAFMLLSFGLFFGKEAGSLQTYLPGSGESLKLTSAGPMLWENIAVGLKVVVALFAVFLALVALRVTPKGFMGADEG
jgi:multicomponent Na+:H+ antiporter subunit B